MGVVSFVDTKWISKGIGSNPWPKEDKHASHWDGIKNWHENETIHILADLTICKIKYYQKQKQGKADMLLKEERLTPGEKYYFALCCDNDKNCVVFQSV